MPKDRLAAMQQKAGGDDEDFAVPVDDEMEGAMKDFFKVELQRRSSKILEECSVKSLLEVGNLYQSSTTLGLDPVSNGPPQTN